MVESDATSEEPIFLPLILEALDLMEEQVERAGLDLKQFSDSVIVSSRFSPDAVGDLIGTVRTLQRLLVERGIAIRGGVAFGRHYAEGHRLFSKALVNAHELESRRANVPRVLVDANLLDWCLHHGDCDSPLRRALVSQLMRDRDGEVFVHYLDEALLASHSALVRGTLDVGRRGSARVLAKAHWLVDYHEHVAALSGQDGLGVDDAVRFQVLT